MNASRRYRTVWDVIRRGVTKQQARSVKRTRARLLLEVLEDRVVPDVGAIVSIPTGLGALQNQSWGYDTQGNPLIGADQNYSTMYETPGTNPATPPPQNQNIP